MFDYKQRPATKEYREGWERAFGKGGHDDDSAVNGRAPESISPRLNPPGASSAREVPALHSSASPNGDGAGLPANRVAWLIDAACDHGMIGPSLRIGATVCLLCGKVLSA